MAGSENGDERITALQVDVAALRTRLDRVEQDAAAARVLAGGADRDVAEVRVELREFRSEFRDFRDQNNRVLSVMREDLTDIRADLTDLRSEMHRGFLQMRGALDATAAGMHQIAVFLGMRMQQGDDRPQQ